MFANYSLKDLRKLVRDTQEHHNITGSSKMKKQDLVNHLHNHFILHDNKVYLKSGKGAGASSQRNQMFNQLMYNAQFIREKFDFYRIVFLPDSSVKRNLINKYDELMNGLSNYHNSELQHYLTLSDDLLTLLRDYVKSIPVVNAQPQYHNELLHASFPTDNEIPQDIAIQITEAQRAHYPTYMNF